MSPRLASRPVRSSHNYPPVLTIPPLSGGHTHTLILLHGRGSNASTFAPALLSTQLPSGLTLAQTLPTTQFVFPTSSFRRATFANRSLITQWFDNASLEDLDACPEIQVAGLRESTVYLHGLIRAAAKEVGLQNVVIGGLSLGACASLVTALTWTEQEESLAGVVCMAVRLPLINMLKGAMGVDDEDGDSVEGEDISFDSDEDDVLDSNGFSGQQQKLPGALAIAALRVELELESELSNTTKQFPGLSTPIFLGHGTQDEKVPVRMGKQAAECLELMGCDVTWREYSDLGHWYHEQELADIVTFLQQKCNFPSSS